MAIDYYGSFPCAVREAISNKDLLQMEKARNRAAAVLNLMRNDPAVDKSRPESEWTFKMVVRGPQGAEESELRISDLAAQAAPLESLARHCVNCPANIRADDFGCGGAIHYPIAAEAEHWLMSRLPDDLESTPGRLLVRAISEGGYDGASIEASRCRKELYAADAPAQRRWGGFFSRKTSIRSSQLLQMVFGVGSMQPSHAQLIAVILGFLNEDLSAKDDPANLPCPQDAPGIAELKFFLLVAAFAGENGTPVFVDA